MKMIVNYLNFSFHIEVKIKSKYKIFDFVFQFIKDTKWHFGYTDSMNTLIPLLREINSSQEKMSSYNIKDGP